MFYGIVKAVLVYKLTDLHLILVVEDELLERNVDIPQLPK